MKLLKGILYLVIHFGLFFLYVHTVSDLFYIDELGFSYTNTILFIAYFASAYIFNKILEKYLVKGLNALLGKIKKKKK